MTKEEAYEELRVRIITNGVAPGEILKEKDLMSQLAIGRSPLREILFRLQEENLIKPLPRLGYMVTTLDIFEVRELVELRRELEGYAGYLAAQRITPEQLEDLRTIIREAEIETSESQNRFQHHGIFRHPVSQSALPGHRKPETGEGLAGPAHCHAQNLVSRGIGRHRLCPSGPKLL